MMMIEDLSHPLDFGKRSCEHNEKIGLIFFEINMTRRRNLIIPLPYPIFIKNLLKNILRKGGGEGNYWGANV